MSFFINENSLRGGNRGGKDRFDWENVKIHDYKNRSHYLGISSKLGSLEGCSKWLKKDWYLDKNNKYQIEISKNEKENLKDEIRRIKEEEAKRMDEMLGIKTMSKNENNKKKELTEFDKKVLFSKEKLEMEDKTLKERNEFNKYKQVMFKKSLETSNDLNLIEDEQKDDKRLGLGLHNLRDIESSFALNIQNKDATENLYKLKGCASINLNSKVTIKEEDSNQMKNLSHKKTNKINEKKKHRSKEEALIDEYYHKMYK